MQGELLLNFSVLKQSEVIFLCRQIATGQEYHVFCLPDSNEYRLLQLVRSEQVPHGQLTDTIERSM